MIEVVDIIRRIRQVRFEKTSSCFGEDSSCDGGLLIFPALSAFIYVRRAVRPEQVMFSGSLASQSFRSGDLRAREHVSHFYKASLVEG